MTVIQYCNAQFGVWLIDAHGSGLLRQSFTVRTSGRATQLIEDVCRHLSRELSWGDYGSTVVPYGLPYGVDPSNVVMGAELAILVRPGLTSTAEYSQATDGVDRSVVSVDVLMLPPREGDSDENRRELYNRMIAVEEAFEAMAGTVLGVDQPGTIALSFSGRNVRADLTDPDGIVSVQEAVFTAPDGSSIVNGDVVERSAEPGTWRALIRNNQNGLWSVAMTYTDEFGPGKMATASAERT